LDITDKVLTAFLEQALYDLAFHPDFQQNGLFYVHFAKLLCNGDSMIVIPSKLDRTSARWWERFCGLT
jgi:hypothetical protein